MGQSMNDDGSDVVREKIEKYMAMVKNGERVSHALKRLGQLDVTLELLSETGVGKVINKLRNDEEYGSKAMTVVEKWKAIAKAGGVSSDREKPSSSSKSHSKSYSYAEPEERISKRSSNKISDSASVDPFAAQLAAADKVGASKPKKPKFSSSIVEEIERSLAMEGGNASRSSSATRSYSPLESEIDAKEGMFKRKGMSKVYSGKKVQKTIKGPVPSLFDICMKVCMNNIDAIEETGDIPFDILKPVLEKCSHTQLARIESRNKYLEEDSDYLWERHCQKIFPNADSGDDDDEPWKERFMRLTHERDQKLKSLSQRITTNARDMVQPQRKAMLSDPIAPRYARQRQIRNGIMVSSAAVPSAAELSKSRRQIFETGSKADLAALPKAMRNTNSTVGGSSSRNNNTKAPAKKGALMLKTLKMMKGRR